MSKQTAGEFIISHNQFFYCRQQTSTMTPVGRKYIYYGKMFKSSQKPQEDGRIGLG